MKRSFGIIGLLLILILSSCSEKIWQTADARYVRYEIGDEEAKDDVLASIVAPYKEQLESKMGIILGELDVDLVKERVESNMGNWYCDVILEEANLISSKPVDFAIQNYGGLRSNSIAAGKITVRTLYELMPFENTLVTAEISGQKVKELFDDLAEYGGAPVSKGVKFDIKDGKAVNVSLNGSPLVPEKMYRVALNDYTANGGDDARIFKDVEIQEYDLLQRDALINHVKRDTKNGIIQTAKKEGRITKLN
jgi:2',3'-cyclic-nucleotide 2'-phosphodiesterase (5'-nucleotidase family)